MNRRTRWRALGAVVAGSAMVIPVAHSQESDNTALDLELGAEHSDNIGRVPVDEQEDTIGTASIALALERHRPKLEADISANLQYRHYLDDSFGDEVVGGADAYLGWLLLPERFVWVVEDNFGQVTRNPLQADTPDNREQTNLLSTGPDITLPLGSRTVFLLSGRYSDNYYEESPSSNESVDATAGIGRKLSEQTLLSVNGSIRDIKYDNSELFADYTIRSAYLRLASTGARTTLEVDAGYAEAERDDKTSDGPLFRLEVSYEITSRSTVTLSGGHVFTDSGEALRVDQQALGPGQDVNTTLAAGDVYRDTYGYLTFDTARETGSFSASIFARKERHEDQVGLDRDIAGAGLTWLHRLGSRLELSFEGSYNDENFVVGDLSFQEWYAGLGLGVRLTPTVSLRTSFYHNVGSGDGTSRDYEENTAYLGIRYSMKRGGR
jgi:hypothetical protein